MPAIATKAKASEAYRTISEVAEDLDLPQHVLRFWETRFTQIKPMKRGGGRRYYRPEDVDLIKGIRTFLYGEGYTIRGLQKIIKETGAAHIMAVGRGEKSIDQIEKPKGPEIIEVHSDVIRTRTRFETGDEKSDNGEQPSFARHLIDTLSQKIDEQKYTEQKIHKQEAPPFIKEPIMEQVKPLPVIPSYSLRTSYSTQPLEIPPLTSAVSHGRGLTKPMTKDPSPLVKFRPIEELPDELPAFVNARKSNPPIETARHEPVFSLASARETRVLEPKIAHAPAQNFHNRLQSALYELSECKRLLSAAF